MLPVTNFAIISNVMIAGNFHGSESLALCKRHSPERVHRIQPGVETRLTGSVSTLGDQASSSPKHESGCRVPPESFAVLSRTETKLMTAPSSPTQLSALDS